MAREETQRKRRNKMNHHVVEFLKNLENNGRLAKLTTNLDNKKVPVHRWFPFLVGFSHSLVATTFDYFGMDRQCYVFDPFIGSGTTAVVGKQLGVNVVGNEAHILLYRIGKAKTSLQAKPWRISEIGKMILNKAHKQWKKVDLREENPLLKRCYSESNLKKLVVLRELYNSVENTYKPHVFLAISMTLRKSANVRINIPYVCWKHKHIPEEVFQSFKESITMIEKDLCEALGWNNGANAKIYLHDSRRQNKHIKGNSMDMIFTSPPYLSNLDYGEFSKVYTYFWKLTKGWNEITDKIRKHLVTSSTTHYSEGELSTKTPSELLGPKFFDVAPKSAEKIVHKIDSIRLAKSKRKGTKSFDIMTAFYFKDMLQVLKEMHRVLKKDGLAFIVIGDSAPYGVYIPTDTLLGEMAVETGFSNYTLKTLRSRGSKWVSLRYRHKVRLRESLMVLE